MKPVFALVGRPNTGKSTLFNCLTGSRAALVSDFPGLTRDRHYGTGRSGERMYIVIDTGGLSGERDDIDVLMAKQVTHAIDEADRVLFLVDARSGLTGADETIAQRLRATGKPLTLVVNKSERMNAALAAGEFAMLGIADVHCIASAHNEGVAAMMRALLADLPSDEETETGEDEGIRIAVIGRPNVGKSTLVNRILGEERMLTFDAPGTTRDSIFVPFERAGRPYTLIDTAGIRRRARVSDTIEKFSIIKSLQAMDAAHVVLLVLDARQGVGEQDARLLGHAVESGRALVVAVNKWDGLDDEERREIRSTLERKLSFIDYATVHYISALHGSGVGNLFESIDDAHAAAGKSLSTPMLTRLLHAAVERHAPPLVRGRRIKLRYAHQGGHHPPVIVIHGNQAGATPDAYRRYLEGWFRDALELAGTPVRIEFRTGANPYEGRKRAPPGRSRRPGTRNRRRGGVSKRG